MRPIFYDQQLQKQFDLEGYVIVPFIDEQRIQRTLKLYNNLNSGINTGFYATLHSKDFNYRKQVNAQLREICNELHQQYLQNYKILLANFVIKLPDGKNSLRVHQDMTFCDESQFTSVNCWFPLVELNEHNGPLMVMKGSHQLFNAIRGTGTPFFPSPIENYRNLIKDKYLTTLRVKPGQAVIHDNRLFHYSPPNTSNAARVAVVLNMIPQEAQPIHYFCNPDGKIEKFIIDEDFFLHLQIGVRPNYPNPELVTNYQMPHITEKQLRNLYNKFHGKNLWQKLKTAFSGQ